ncbi:hypothetical protein D9611_009838 [Ephemerocybe angulata]|uniref:C2H2-type domain-containing protein n=1 Tax=Ephemerocybe angulata TaxID=980116 RepID=A0A8H5FJP4_9AGAR|nr:hypothetical protein D9611_009838 [Tulosesus angulatus]
MYTEYYCNDCTHMCKKLSGIRGHCKSKGHLRLWNIKWFCEQCNVRITATRLLHQHIDSGEHRRVIAGLGVVDSPVVLRGCPDCDRVFRTDNGLNNHCLAMGHRGEVSPAPPVPGWICAPCDEKFYKESTYLKHCRSEAHTKPIRCNFSGCTRRFKTPSAYANHLESGFHGITLSPTVGAATSRSPTDLLSGIQEVADFLSGETAQQSVPEYAPGEPGPPLGPREEAVATLSSAEASEDSTLAVTTTPTGPQTISPEALRLALGPIPEAPQYVVNDFAHLGIPFACPTCAKTFKKIISLTAHMNSPAHDADAFLCPGCDRHFPLVSSLIQHLESGCCELASKEEVFDRFLKMTDRFSRMLIA